MRPTREPCAPASCAPASPALTDPRCARALAAESGAKYYLPEETGTKARSGATTFKPGDWLTLRVEKEATGAGAARARRIHHHEPLDKRELPVYAQNNASTYRVLETLARVPRPEPRASTRASVESRTVYIMRLVYTNSAPDYCDEACARDGMWGSVASGWGDVRGSVDGLYRESSFGKSSFDESNSVVLSVNMGTEPRTSPQPLDTLPHMPSRAQASSQ